MILSIIVGVAKELYSDDVEKLPTPDYQYIEPPDNEIKLPYFVTLPFVTNDRECCPISSESDPPGSDPSGSDGDCSVVFIEDSKTDNDRQEVQPGEELTTSGASSTVPPPSASLFQWMHP